MDPRRAETLHEALAYMEHRHCPTCRHHEVDDKGDHWCALGISTAGRVTGLVTHLQPFGCSLYKPRKCGCGPSDECRDDACDCTCHRSGR